MESKELKKHSSAWSKIAVGVGSLLLAAGVGWLFGKWTGVSAVAAVALHEFGHLMAMKKFGYKNTGVVFLPLLGGAAFGSNDKSNGWQRILILLAGPMPGIALGTCLWWFGNFGGNAAMRNAGEVFVIVNAFNCIPLSPLDGGRLMEEIFGGKSRIIFSGLGVVAFIAMGFITGSFLWGIPALISGLILQESLFVLKAARNPEVERFLDCGGLEEIRGEDKTILEGVLGRGEDDRILAERLKLAKTMRGAGIVGWKRMVVLAMMAAAWWVGIAAWESFSLRHSVPVFETVR